MATYCSHCAAPLFTRNEICHRCGWKAGTPEDGAMLAMELHFQEKRAAALSYFFLPAVFYLMLEPYRSSRLVRFHAVQSMGYVAVWLVTFFALGAMGIDPLFFISSQWIAEAFLIVLAGLHMFVMFKAYRRERFKLPLIGAMAERQSESAGF